MLGKNARHFMRQHLHRGHRRRNRRDKLTADTGGGRADQDDLVAVLGEGNLAALHIKERVDRKCGLSLAIAVKEGLHAGRRIGGNFELAELHLLAGAHLNIRRRQIEAARRNQQRQGRDRMLEMSQNQGIGTNGTVHIRQGVEMTDHRRLGAKRIHHTGINIQRGNQRKFV